jgi:hypothetical protein
VLTLRLLQRRAFFSLMNFSDAFRVETHKMHRVKLYKLNSQGLWDDKGTGHVASEYLPVRL